MSIRAENLNYEYIGNSGEKTKALDDISFEIKTGEFISIIGHTGSGKSTLMQILMGLIKKTSGNLYIDDIDFSSDKFKSSKLIGKVGLVFQYPEYQLFEETVFKDVAFGPKNLNLSKEEIKRRTEYALDIVGASELRDASPFELSGGQKRRIAIAGVLAMEPDILILDEPTAGLDPKSREQILDLIQKEHKLKNRTTITVTHNMSDAARISDRIIVMEKAKIKYFDKPEIVFGNYSELNKIGLDTPMTTKCSILLNELGFDMNLSLFDVESWADELSRQILQKKAENKC